MTTFDIFSKEVKPRTLDNPDRTKEILNAFIKVGPIPQNGQYILLNPAILQHNPNTQYTFDSERGSSESEICREGGREGRECLTVSSSNFYLEEKFVHGTHVSNAIVENDF